MGRDASSEPNGESIAAALLEAEGYAAFEYLGGGQFRALGKPPRFCAELLGSAAADGAAVALAERMPFLESFLPDAEDNWNSSTGGRVESGTWIEQADAGREVALEASALRLGEKRILLIRNPQKDFDEESGLLQKARESALEHERLLREIQKKEILLHCVIHDLTQPLTAIRGCFALLAAESLSPKLQHLIEIGQRQSRNQEEMIRSVLQAFSEELAAQDAAAHDAAQAPDLVKCAQQVAQDYAGAFEERGARIELDSGVDLGSSWRVVGEESRLRRIYTNLLENALRYSSAGGRVMLGAIDEGRFVRAYVDDEGPGLPTGEGAPKLFALFGKGKEGGGKAGLGLYFCKITAERWGGSIGAENRPDRGTRFWFRLPKAEATVEVSPPAAAPIAVVKQSGDSRSGRHLRLLLADDTPVNRQITSLLLERQGHAVLAVENGAQALARLDTQPFDAVILDEEMPEMGGLEVAREIRKREAKAGGHLPLILVTGNASETARARSRAAGVDAHFAKPYEDEELFRKVAELCGADRATPTAEATSESTQPSSGRVDEQELLRRLGGSAKMLRDVAKIFTQDTPKRVAAIRKAIEQQDGATLAAAAHALRGSLAMLGAAEIAAEMRKVESLAKDGQVAEAREIFASIEGKLAAFKKLIAGFAGSSTKQRKAGRADGSSRARGKAR